MTAVPQIRPRERDGLLQSLRAGVVPRVGQQLIQVGRVHELKALIHDLERIADGGSAVRFVIGEYGSGKTFFLHLIRSVALEKKLVTVHADLTPDRRLHATGGQARALYAELMRNMATRTRPEGGAIGAVVERFVSTALSDAQARGVNADVVIREHLGSLSELVGGFDFATVVEAYWRGHDRGDDVLKNEAIRWLRGEFTAKTDARAALGVRTIVEDGNFYDQLKLLARFVRLAGFSGLLVCMDELVNLYKLAHSQARNANYEQILRILNDGLQGTASGVGVLFGGTPEFLMDGRRGLYSYQALQSRLAENRFTASGLVDFSGPVLRLANLSPEDIFVLLRNLRHVYASGEPSKYLLPDDGLHAFMRHCSKQLGDAYFRTPRSTITGFVNLLAVLEQNPGADWKTLVGQVALAPDSEPDALAAASTSDAGAETGPEQAVDDLASFKL
ncbi:MAG: ATP-binding protein [Deltaproteobacteria bacterium]|nr:ATP-binding protein [Deltaproteobacteria bacterium]